MKRIFSYIIIFLISYNFAYAQYQNNVVSFRSKALAEIISDDLDLIYDPIELRYVSGIRVYTNLSNLTSTNEKIFDSYADNEFLAGLSSKSTLIKNLLSSVLVRFQNSKTSNYISIDPGLTGSSIGHYGSYTDEYTSYIDNLPYDGIYDVKTMISQTKSNFTEDNSYAFILNNTYISNQSTVGLRFSVGRQIIDFNTSSYPWGLGSGQNVLSKVWSNSPDFSLSHSTYIVEQNYINNKWSENGDFLTRLKNSYISFDAAFMKPYTLNQIGNVELRFDGGYWHENFVDKIADKYNGTIQHFQLALTEYDSSYQESDFYKNLTEWSGASFLIGVSIKKLFDPQPERKNDGYWKLAANFKYSSYDYTYNLENNFSNNSSFFDGLDTLQTDTKIITRNLNSTEDIGDEDVFLYSLAGKINIPLSEKVYFGTGGIYCFTRTKRETDYIFTLLDKIEYTEIDSINISNNFIETTSSEESADRSWQRDILQLIFPVGIEYKFTKNNKWTVRFGAIFYYHKEVINDAKQITNSVPPVEVMEWGDGTIEVGEVPTENSYESTSSQTKTTTSTTTFTYGLGFIPTKNLQIDLLGFFGTSDNSVLDSQFYRNLRLSFSLKL